MPTIAGNCRFFLFGFGVFRQANGTNTKAAITIRIAPGSTALKYNNPFFMSMKEVPQIKANLQESMWGVYFLSVNLACGKCKLFHFFSCSATVIITNSLLNVHLKLLILVYLKIQRQIVREKRKNRKKQDYEGTFVICRRNFYGIRKHKGNQESI
jgi:hypothetical protein